MRRYVSFVFILFVIAFGTSLSIRANLGSSPISAPPYVLSLIPGTSRSGSTIIGSLIIGISRKAAAEFTLFLAVTVMFGLSALQMLKYFLEFGFCFDEIFMLVLGMLVAFAVSLFVIKFLMEYLVYVHSL